MIKRKNGNFMALFWNLSSANHNLDHNDNESFLRSVLQDCRDIFRGSAFLKVWQRMLMEI